MEIQVGPVSNHRSLFIGDRGFRTHFVEYR